MTGPTGFIADEQSFARVVSILGSVFELSQNLPAQVFRAPLTQFRFLEFGQVMRPGFWTLLSGFAKLCEEREVAVAVLDPHMRSYFHTHFGYYGAIVLPTSASDAQYFDMLAAEPSGSPADAIIYNGRRLVFCGESSNWGIWADRHMGIGVLGVRGSLVPKLPESLAREFEWFTAEEAVEGLMALEWAAQEVPPEVAAALRRNYSAWAGRPGP